MFQSKTTQRVLRLLGLGFGLSMGFSACGETGLPSAELLSQLYAPAPASEASATAGTLPGPNGPGNFPAGPGGMGGPGGPGGMLPPQRLEQIRSENPELASELEALASLSPEAHRARMQELMTSYPQYFPARPAGGMPGAFPPPGFEGMPPPNWAGASPAPQQAGE